jgi:drug/metabolite transporter (DMT)-like permease
MRQLSSLETALLLLGGLLMVVGSGATVFMQPWAAYVFAPGSLLFAAMQMRQRYDGSSFVIRRLRRILLFSDALFMVAGLLLLANAANFLPIDHLSYVRYVHNNWIVVLLVAAILQLYASHRIANELEKEAKKR